MDNLEDERGLLQKFSGGAPSFEELEKKGDNHRS